MGFGNFKTEHAAFPYGAHFVEVAVNVRTGEVKLRRFHAYQDCGTPINPALAMGQIYGGVMKAVGHSLYEEMLYDEEGRCLNPRFLDYKIPVDLRGARGLPRGVRARGGRGRALRRQERVRDLPERGGPRHIHRDTRRRRRLVREWPFTPERVLKALGKI